jgi:hypothetical protein
MVDVTLPRIARVDRHELGEFPSSCSDAERGQRLRRLLHLRGIDPGRLFRVEYYPHHLCWLVLQEPADVQSAAVGGPQSDATFYTQILGEFRRSARTAYSRVAAHSLQFARFGCKYELPPEPQDMTPADLADQLGGPAPVNVRFDPEGGWQYPDVNTSPGRR